MPRAKSNSAPAPVASQTKDAVAWLKKHSSKATRAGMARYAIPSDNALGVTVANIRLLGKQLSHNHDLAAALWDTGIYEARMLAAFVEDPALVSSAQMDRWCKDFDNWAICDTVCFSLFDRTPHAWTKVSKWSGRKPEFERRAAFALLWGLTTHDKAAPDANFLTGLRLIEQAATDDRNFVRKATNMALRATGKRNLALNEAAVKTARRLAESQDSSARWVGKDAFKELTSVSVAKRLGARRAK